MTNGGEYYIKLGVLSFVPHLEVLARPLNKVLSAHHVMLKEKGGRLTNGREY